MPRSLQEILAELREHPLDDVRAFLTKPQEQGGWHELRQAIFDEGHQAATAQTGTKLRGLETLNTTLTTERDAARNRVRELESAAPENKKLQEQYDADLRTEKERNAARETEMNNTLLAERRSGRITKLAKVLNTKYKVHDQRDNEVATQHADRFDFPENKLVVKQLGKDIPYSAATEDEAIEALAKDISKTLQPWSFRSEVGRGAGLHNGGPGNGDKPITVETIKEAKKADPEYNMI